ncbi:hypothetical protein SIID45300_01784 [Candidatus Magnetaquicoccaceae bacterium FCR-1]|uniref:Uncharacterized protein n=1 Tax=Candidatus Magnetaquiglobus chichijimensis TaxID=3141448 RepID=A0ABQ0C994_9PROT
MRKEFLEVSTRYMAKKLAPWAAIIAKADGGYMAFESVTDYWTWKQQK